MEDAPDHNILETFLSVVIPRRDVKPLAYDLINTFGSLEGVINAAPQDLMTVKGVGESTAVAISLIKKMNDRVIKNRNHNIVKIITLEDAKEYCINELSTETVEKLIQVNIKNDGTIINKYLVSTGTVNGTTVDNQMIVRNALRDNSAYTFIAHNHPNGPCSASGNDIDVTFRLKQMFKDLRVNLIDHFIVAGDDCELIIHNPLFEEYFNKSK